MDIAQHVTIAINWELKVFMNCPDQVSDSLTLLMFGQIAHPYMSDRL